MRMLTAGVTRRFFRLELSAAFLLSFMIVPSRALLGPIARRASGILASSQAKVKTSIGKRRFSRPSLMSLSMSSSSSSSSSVATTPRGGSSNSDTDNPLLSSWATQPFLLPPFEKIEPCHFKPALLEGMQRELEDLQAIVDNLEPASFDNVYAAYDRAGRLLSKVSGVFGNMCSSLNPEELQQVQTEMSPILSRHSSKCMTLPGLFDKMNVVYQQRHELAEKEKWTPEQMRLVERVHLDFTRAGALFSDEDKEEYANIKAELASLTTAFQQNVMKDEETYELVLQRDDLSGCPDSLIQSARQAAVERNKAENEYVITLSRSLVEPFLTFSDRRDLRQQAFEAWTQRGELHPDRNNLNIATDILRLRRRMAQLHGYKSFAEFQCVDRMAKTPHAVHELLSNVWERAKDAANRERQALEAYVAQQQEQLQGGIQPWDWRYYAEKVRKAKYDFDESLLKPYLSLEKVTDALMAVSNNLFGLRYKERPDITAYHPDVKIYEVREKESDGTEKLVAIFLTDNYARKHKNSGAWMSEYRTQSKNLPLVAGEEAARMEGIPIISNNNNFAKGENTLLSFDDAKTLFHEAGHGHHGMLSDCTYQRLASTNVVTDFVELPSQLMEHWFNERQVLQKYARHYQTGEPVPDELLDRLEAARKFNQGFATIEYTVCALFDMALHELEEYPEGFDLAAFERQVLKKLGMPQGIVMRHRPAHFQHLFSTNMYAAGYYVYQWAEVLDADVFAAFKEAGDIFDKETAAKARKYIYSAGNTVAPDELFRQFRGRDPDIQYMLEKKGLVGEMSK